MQRKSLTIFCSSLALAACSPSESGKFSQETAQSIKFGESAKDETPPYGLALYPNARVTLSMMDGMGLQIESESSQKDIGEFYRNEAERLGYSKITFEDAASETKVAGTNPNAPNGKLIISISNASEKAGSDYILLFMKVSTEK